MLLLALDGCGVYKAIASIELALSDSISDIPAHPACLLMKLVSIVIASPPGGKLGDGPINRCFCDKDAAICIRW